MAYEPRTTRGQWVRDQVLAALREHGPLNTSTLAKVIGYRVDPGPTDPGSYPPFCSACRKHHPYPVKRPVDAVMLQPTTTVMLRHGELVRARRHTADIWTWGLGPNAPAAVDLSDFVSLLPSSRSGSTEPGAGDG